ncbi:MAG TPA: hypothetical protein VLC08_08265 [Chitinolyticbacter sp.]|nr:hypothetical protein [Chitinolyticbacter sp.]
MTEQPTNATESTTPDVATPPAALPAGYLWRFLIVTPLLLGAAGCFLFYNAIVGAVLLFAGLAVAKLSGLNDILKADAERMKSTGD